MSSYYETKYFNVMDYDFAEFLGGAGTHTILTAMDPTPFQIARSYSGSVTQGRILFEKDIFDFGQEIGNHRDDF